MIDSHCHLADEAFAPDLDAVCARARDVGVGRALCILDVTSPDEGGRADAVAGAWPEIRFATGVHPHQAGAFAERLADVGPRVRAALAARPAACAVGEIGLDYHYDVAPRAIQNEVFRRQIELARDIGLPLVIHTREADDDTLAALRAEGDRRVTGVFHCFTGDAAFARAALDLGFYVSFSGIVTFRSADAIREAAALVPADRLLIETDAPYLAPVPYRGKRNEPAWVTRVADVVAEVRHETTAQVVEAASRSYDRLFASPVSTA